MVLAEYLIDYLGNLAADLNWTETSLVTVTEDTLSDYGVDYETEVTDTKKYKALGKVNLWEKALIELSSKFDFSADGGSFSRSQFFEMVKQNYEQAVSEALVYLPNYQIEKQELSNKFDPYSYIPFIDRTL